MQIVIISISIASSLLDVPYVPSACLYAAVNRVELESKISFSRKRRIARYCRRNERECCAHSIESLATHSQFICKCGMANYHRNRKPYGFEALTSQRRPPPNWRTSIIIKYSKLVYPQLELINYFRFILIWHGARARNWIFEYRNWDLLQQVVGHGHDRRAAHSDKIDSIDLMPKIGKLNRDVCSMVWLVPQKHFPVVSCGKFYWSNNLGAWRTDARIAN